MSKGVITEKYLSMNSNNRYVTCHHQPGTRFTADVCHTVVKTNGLWNFSLNHDIGLAFRDAVATVLYDIAAFFPLILILVGLYFLLRPARAGAATTKKNTVTFPAALSLTSNRTPDGSLGSVDEPEHEWLSMAASFEDHPERLTPATVDVIARSLTEALNGPNRAATIELLADTWTWYNEPEEDDTTVAPHAGAVALDKAPSPAAASGDTAGDATGDPAGLLDSNDDDPSASR